jgi:hypothetical protein
MASTHHVRRAPSLAVAVAALALAAPSSVHAGATRPADPPIYVQPPELASVEEQAAARSGETHATLRRTDQEAQVLASRGVGAPAPASHTGAPRAQATDAGFDWGSAGIGAAVAGGLIVVAAGGLGAAHRSRIRLAR